jgi:large subunit ribosomal protein L28
MSNKCSLTGRQTQFGNNVSHSKRRTRRKFEPNVQTASFVSEYLGKLTLKVVVRTIKTIDFKGGIDAFLLNTKSNKLTDQAIKLKRKLKKAIAKKK